MLYRCITLLYFSSMMVMAIPIYIGVARANLTVGALPAPFPATAAGARTDGRIENHFDPEKCGFSEGYYLSEGMVQYSVAQNAVLLPFVNFLLVGQELLGGPDPNIGLDIVGIFGVDEGLFASVTANSFRAEVNTEARTHGDVDADVAMQGPVAVPPAAAAAVSTAGPTPGKGPAMQPQLFSFFYRSSTYMVKNGDALNPIQIVNGAVNWVPGPGGGVPGGTYQGVGDFQACVPAGIPGDININFDCDLQANIPVNAVAGDTFQFFTINEAFMRTEYECVPEPSSAMLLAGGIVWIAGRWRRRYRPSAHRSSRYDVSQCESKPFSCPPPSSCPRSPFHSKPSKD